MRTRRNYATDRLEMEDEIEYPLYFAPKNAFDFIEADYPMTDEDFETVANYLGQISKFMNMHQPAIEQLLKEGWSMWGGPWAITLAPPDSIKTRSDAEEAIGVAFADDHPVWFSWLHEEPAE